MDLNAFVDSIYEAALVPELWPDLLDGLTREADALGSMCFTASPTRTNWVSSREVEPLLARFLADGWMARNTRVERALKLDLPGFVSDQDMFTPEEMDRDPMIAYLRQNGGGWCTGTLITMPSGDLLVFNIERSHRRGPFEPEVIARLETLRPDLHRAALLSARLGFEKARAAAAALAAVGLPAGVLSHSGRLIAANDLLTAMMPSVVLDRRDRVQLAGSAPDALLKDALDRLASQLMPQVASIALPATHAHPAMVAHLVPVRRNARDVFASANAFLMVTPVSAAAVPGSSLLQALFDLTRAEARVAKGIMEGKTPADLARTLGVSVDTVRTQLKSVFAKVGVSRQADLVRLLGGLTITR
ncbi:helix-turn-helix transcriptional regulator [Chthonobacter rhizosphaerae]|uniref:helix-turn-helix transcriptional regulator n=1 Tax=Chthonobacter rhizosphaerae TaxID=2735553 RepID=UPI0015EF7640|nr:helix-turn-helix transcriptional regulator [Chthonobacter rhizosphaerae]